MAEVNINHTDILYNNINKIGESVDKIENTVSKENEELKNKLELMEKELEEAKASSNHWEQKYTELVHKCNQYEELLRDFDNVADRIIDNFNGIVNGIRIKYDEGFIRKNYKEMDFSSSGNVPVYIYKNETLRYISNFIATVRCYSKNNNYVTQDPVTIDRRDRKLATRVFKSIREYYKYLIS